MRTCNPSLRTIFEKDVELLDQTIILRMWSKKIHKLANISRGYQIEVKKINWSKKSCYKISSTVNIVSHIPFENVDIFATSNLVCRLFWTFLMSGIIWEASKASPFMHATARILFTHPSSILLQKNITK